MKFEAVERTKIDHTPSAFIDTDGDLFIICQSLDGTAVCLRQSGSVLSYDADEFSRELEGATTLFYPGDQITLTF